MGNNKISIGIYYDYENSQKSFCITYPQCQNSNRFVGQGLFCEQRWTEISDG